MVPKNVPMNRQDPRRLLQMISDLSVKGGKFVKGNGRADMMLGVIGHVPKQECHYGVHFCRPRILPEVRTFRAAGVLDDPDGAHDRFRQDSRNEPVDKWCPSFSGECRYGDRSVNRQGDAGLQKIARQLILRKKNCVTGQDSSTGMPEQRAEVPTPEIYGGALENVLPYRRRASQHHFRVLTLDLGVGVVVGVFIAVPKRSADIDKVAKPKHGLI